MTSVYVIQAENGPVKVGIAGNVKSRLSKLRCSSAVHLKLVYFAEAGDHARAIEGHAHGALAKDRMAGEWFSVPPEEAIKAVESAAKDIKANIIVGELDPPKRAVADLEMLVSMTPAQCRAGRALLEMKQPDLAKAADVGLSTVVDFEKSRRTVSAEAMSKLAMALEAAGVVFLDEGAQADGGPGVRLRKDPE